MNLMSRKPAYKDRFLPVARRVADLLGKMTTEEKIGQLNLKLGWKCYEKKGNKITVSEYLKKNLSKDKVGGFYGTLRADPWTGVTLVSGLTPNEGAEAVNLIQKYNIENTRLGIPLLFSEECTHGHMAIGATVFPVPIAMASAWDPELMERVGRAIARETRAQGGVIGYGPVCDLAREPRWSRVEETFGEDPCLAGAMGAAMVKGVQGKTLDSRETMVATLKHFAAYGEPEGGHNCAPVHVGVRELNEIFLAPFLAAVRAGALSVMASYNEIDGVPCVCDKGLLTGILRKKWNFKGFVVSDCNGIETLSSPSVGIAGNLFGAAALALNAGCDMNLGGAAYEIAYLKEALRKGKLSVKTIDRAAGMILRIKFLLGLFENPYVDTRRVEEIVGSTGHRRLAGEVARKSLTLLKNKNNILPLKKNIKSIAVIGPNADDIYNQLGDYTAPQPPQKITTVLKGIKDKLGEKTVVNYASGCRIKSESKAGFRQAVEAAGKSEVIIAVVGGSSSRYSNAKYAATGAAIVDAAAGNDMECGEGLDRSELDLAGVQGELLKELRKTGAPLVVVLIKGRPLSINWIAENADAVIDAWYPGEDGGNAIADVLFGDYNPAGRLPVSVPKSVGQLPVYYNYKPKARREYVFLDEKPLYPFGFGLSYTKFRYANLKISPGKITARETATVSVEVKNAGKAAGDEVVQLYIRDEISSVTRPMRELKNFRRIHLKPGETKKVTFDITPEELKFYDINNDYVVEPGKFTLMVGGNQSDLITGILEISDK